MAPSVISSCSMAAALLALAPGAAAVPHQAQAAAATAASSESSEQKFYIIRHGDKYSSYPPCPQGYPLCFNASLMGNNPPITPCGVQQAEATAEWLATNGDVQQIVASPYVRSLETALPLARKLDAKIHVENFASEARQDDGPFRPDNVALNVSAVQHLREISALWDESYGSAPIPVPVRHSPGTSSAFCVCLGKQGERLACQAGTLQSEATRSDIVLAAPTHL
jgi:phosphohistidine phosphatase SixA